MVLITGQPEVFSREMVRPSTATPDHLRNHSLSFFDQMAPPFYIPLLYLYPNHDHHHSTDRDLVENRTRVLKLSLAKALFTYYPLAGTTTTMTGDRDHHDPLTVRCNDEGVVFLQARMINADLATSIMNHPDDAGSQQRDDREARLRLLFPDDLSYKSTTSLSSPLVVQVTGFDCGGMALAICASHKVLDMSSLVSFVNYWAAMAADSGQHRIEQHHVRFDLATMFPPVNVQVTKTFEPPNVKTVCKRFVFGGSSVAKLKAMLGNKIENPTRVEVVLALVCSSAISAARTCCSLTSSDGSRSQLRSTILTQAVNLRRRLTSQPSTTGSVGNLSSIFAMSIASGDEMDVFTLVSMIRRVKTEYFSSCSAEYSRGEGFRSFIVETTKVFRDASSDEEATMAKVYISSSWCNFSIYEADFGWGKPMWATTAAPELKDTIVLLDTREGDGVEALVCLEEREMDAFQRDKMLLTFTNINNPSCS